MPDVIALYKIAYLYMRIVLPLCTWSLSIKSNLFLFLVMRCVNEPFKVACVVLIRKIKASPPFVEFLQHWGKQWSASVLSCKSYSVQVCCIFISWHLFCFEKEKWVTSCTILNFLLSRREQNSIIYNILLTGVGCIICIDNITDSCYKGPEKYQILWHWCLYALPTQLILFTTWPFSLISTKLTMASLITLSKSHFNPRPVKHFSNYFMSVQT